MFLFILCLSSCFETLHWPPQHFGPRRGSTLVPGLLRTHLHPHRRRPWRTPSSWSSPAPVWSGRSRPWRSRRRPPGSGTDGGEADTGGRLRGTGGDGRSGSVSARPGPVHYPATTSQVRSGQVRSGDILDITIRLQSFLSSPAYFRSHSHCDHNKK